MALSRFVFDATADNFQRMTLENSQRGLVLVNFWTPKAGPCMILMPRLVRLATEFNGKFLLVMLNTDELGRIAREFGVNSVPTVKFFRHGQVVHTVHGAESEQSFRDQINRFIVQDTVNLYVHGLSAKQSGQFEESKKLLAAAAVAEPGNPAIPLELAKLLWANEEREQALALLESLPAELRNNRDLSNLQAHFSMALAAGESPDSSGENADEALALFRQAASKITGDEMEAGLELLVELDAAHPGYKHGLPRQCLLALFDFLGTEHPLTRQVRARLAARNN